MGTEVLLKDIFGDLPYRKLVEAIGDCALLHLDHEGHIVSWNAGATEVFGYSEAEIIGQPYSVLFTNEDQQSGVPARELTEVLETGRAEDTRWHPRRDSTRFYASSVTTALLDEQGGLCGFAKVLRDDTARMQMELALSSSEVRYPWLFEAAHDGILILHARTGQITDVNPFLCEFLGYQKAEFLGKELWEIGLFKDKDESQAAFRMLQETGYIRYEDIPLETKDGLRREVEFISNVYREGARLVIQCNIRDITERKAAEESIGFQAHLLNTVEQAVIATDIDGIIIYWNQFARKLYGWTAEEAIGRQVMELTTPEIMADQALEIMSQLRKGESWAGEFKVQRRDGTTFPAHVINSPINDDQGKLIGIVGVSIDITERKRQEESLRELTLQLERQARVFDTTLSSITDFAYIFDSEGRFVYVNQALLDLWGLPLEDARGKNFFDLKYPDELAAKLQQQIQQVFDTKQVLTDETPYTSPTGKGGYYEYIFSPVIAADGMVENVAGSTRDITKRKEAEEERERLLQSIKLERSRILYLFEHSPSFVAVLRGPAHVFELVNPPYQQIIGQRDVIGKTAREALPEITDQGYFELLDNVYRTGEPYVGKEMHLQVRRAGAMEEVYLNFVYQPIFETDGSVSGIFAHGVDVTDQVKARREGLKRHNFVLMKTNAALQAEASARQRVEHERGQLLRRIVFTQEDERRRIAREMHDQFGQQLTALTLKLDALKEECLENANLHEQLEALQAIARQLDADVDHMVWEMRPLALDDLGLQAALSSYTQNWSQHFNVPVQLHASGMAKDRLPPEIETTLYRIAQEALNNVAKHAEARSVAVMLERRADQVSLIIEDDGIGFDLQQVFAAEDKGLGLIGMRERAMLVGGIIEIESQPDEGTTVVVRIPVLNAMQMGEPDE